MKELKTLLSDIFDISEKEIDNNIYLNEIKGWDSVKHMELILTIEENYNISLTGDEIASLKSFSDIVKMINSK